METNSRNKFIDFLKKNKSYPDDCFLIDEHIVDSAGKNQLKKIFCDLVILDTSNNNYLALIDFKKFSKERITEDEIYQYQTYIRVLNKPLLSYYFVEFINEELQIFILKDNTINKINLEDFPSYNTLKSKVIADRKDAIELELKKINQEKKKRKDMWFTSLIGASISAILGILLSTNILFSDKDSKRQSLETREKVEILLAELDSLYFSKRDLTIVDSSSVKNDKLLFEKFGELNTRVLTIEQLIDQNPPNLMQIQDFNHKIQDLHLLLEKSKENYDVKLSNLESKLNTYLTIIFTLTAAIIGAIATFIVSYFRK